MRLFTELFEALHQFHILPYTEEAERIYQAMPPDVKRIGKNDCRIAATALANNCLVVTTNTRDFTRIPNLRIEDWTQRKDG